jgi:predicted dehydrogenase
MSYLVIGAGSIGKRHFTNLQALGADVALQGWRDTELGGLSLDGLTGLVIATETQVRLALVAKAAEAGVPVYVEKPLAYRVADLQAVMAAARPVADRSVLGLMMRYHPAIRHVARLGIDAYGLHLEIGHDVRQWRENWSFANSYAARPDGGGVLLDLCHEIDLAACLVPGLTVTGVDCVGHTDFPGVDFATSIGLAGGTCVGRVAMDYLSPVFFRRLSLKGRDEGVDLDLLAPSMRHWTAGGVETQTWTFERNDMFLDLMRDFMALAERRETSGNPLMPRLDRVRESTHLVASAWDARTFHGQLKGGFA